MNDRSNAEMEARQHLDNMEQERKAEKQRITFNIDGYINGVAALLACSSAVKTEHVVDLYKENKEIFNDHINEIFLNDKLNKDKIFRSVLLKVNKAKQLEVNNFDQEILDGYEGFIRFIFLAVVLGDLSHIKETLNLDTNGVSRYQGLLADTSGKELAVAFVVDWIRSDEVDNLLSSKYRKGILLGAKMFFAQLEHIS